MSKKQYIGLDLGTNSVGWAVTNEEYKVEKAKGKLLYGSRIFEAGKDASERRAYRSTRRRLKRRKDRIALLQSLFAEPISKIDFEFFQRLNESAYYGGGKTVKGKFSLFNDKGFSDKEYYEKYPTIYHLRKELIENPEKKDVRLLYLALHHMIKYRGNFLLQGQKLNNEGSQDTTYIVGLFNKINDYYLAHDINTNLDLNNPETFVSSLLLCRGKSNTKNELIKIFDTKDKLCKNLLNVLAGGSVAVKSLYEGIIDCDGIEPAKIQMSKASFEEDDKPKLMSYLGEDGELIETLNLIYSWIQFKRILNGSQYYSFAMVERYNQYKKDLADLKHLYRTYLTSEDYKNMFRISSDKLNNYTAYNRGTQYGDKKRYAKGCNYADFIKAVSKDLEKNADKLSIKKTDEAGNVFLIKNEAYKNILNRLSQEDFLKKIVTTDNGVLPYQINKLELEKILENQSRYYDFLTIKDGEYTTIDKIIKLLEYRIPYYVGPLNAHSTKESGEGFAWAVRKQDGKVTPWNFKEMIDEDKSETRFIRNMTNKCSYLLGEDVLPKESITYQKYMVLNELNNIRMNGERLSVELKKEIFNNLFCERKKVTINTLRKFIVASGRCSQTDSSEVVISGLADDFKSSMSTYIDFKKIIGKVDINNIDMLEAIVNWMTISPDIKRVQKRISENYHDRLNESQISAISHLKFQGWGKFSKKLLDSEDISYVDPVQGEELSIINLLLNTKLNFMEILNNKQYCISDRISDFNSEIGVENHKVGNDDVDELYISPTVKRPVKQTLKIIRELKKVTKKNPDRIFVEVTRERLDENRRKTPDSRKNQLLKLFQENKKAIQKTVDNYNELIAEINGKDVGKLRQDKLFLYFSQLGKDMYTGKPIDIEELSGRKYDIDHIYPQSLIKDDSLTNRVLVSKESNARKKDTYPFVENIDDGTRGMWKNLRNMKLISSEKYNRLIRNSVISAEELSGFIAKQIVTTSQAMKAVINLLQTEYPESKVIWSKGGHVSKFRQKFELLKSREANDYHHAKDAYLNIVVGNIFYTKYTKMSFIEMAQKKLTDEKYSINPKNIYNNDIPGAWNITGKSKTIDIVKKYMSYNNVLFTVMPYIKKGEFYSQNLSCKGDNSSLAPIKESGTLSDVTKYGGYNSSTIAYYFVVESDGKKGKRKRTIESLPIMYVERYEKSSEFAKQLLIDKFGLSNPKILVKRIMVNTPLKIKNSPCRITGKSVNSYIISHNIQWNVNQDTMNYLHTLEKYRDRQKRLKTFDVKNAIDVKLDKIEINNISESNNPHKLKLQFITKEKNIIIYEDVLNQMQKPIFNGLSFKNPIGTIAKKQKDFETLNIKSQVIVLFEMLNYLKCNVEKSDLTIIGGSKFSGGITLGKNITDKTFKVLSQSITGIYENTVFDNLKD